MNVMHFIKQQIGGEPKTIFEFGFYDGDDSLSYRKNFFKANIFSFEPDISNFNKHKHLLEAEEIHAFNLAITNKTGEIDFYPRIFTKEIAGKPIGFHSPGSGILPITENAIIDWGDFQRFDEPPIKVPCITISDFCKQYDIKKIDYMHIDVEGAIKEVLEGFGGIRPTLIKAETGVWKSYKTAISQEDSDIMFDKYGYTVLLYKDENTFYKYRSNS